MPNAECGRKGDAHHLQDHPGRKAGLCLSFRIPHSAFCIPLCLALYLLFFHRLADRDLWSSHEARAAMDAESILDGDWRLPHLNDGRTELQKPPLYYWLVALTARLRGSTVDACAVRLPPAVSALCCVALLA